MSSTTKTLQRLGRTQKPSTSERDERASDTVAPPAAPAAPATTASTGAHREPLLPPSTAATAAFGAAATPLALRSRLRRGARALHAAACALVVAAAAGLVGFGMWLRAADSGVPELALHAGGDSWHPLFLDVGAGLMGAGAFALLATLLAALAYWHLQRRRRLQEEEKEEEKEEEVEEESGEGHGTVVGHKKVRTAAFTALYAVLAAAAALAVLSAGAACAAAAVRAAAPRNRATAAAAWLTSVAVQPRAVCRIQRRFACRGFQAGQCEGCGSSPSPSSPSSPSSPPSVAVGPASSSSSGTGARRVAARRGAVSGSADDAAMTVRCASPQMCPRCADVRDEEAGNVHRGCYDAILARVRRVFVPVGATALAVGFIALVDVAATVCI